MRIHRNFDRYNKQIEAADPVNTKKADKIHGYMTKKDKNPVHATKTEKNQERAIKENENEVQDTVILSEEGIESAKDTRVEKNNNRQGLFRQLKEAAKQGEAMGDALHIRMICLRIATHIISGDDVPVKDKRYLAKNDFPLYTKAISMRIVKKKPKKLKSISEEDEGEDDGKETGDLQEAGNIKGVEEMPSADGSTQAVAGVDSGVGSETV